MNKTNELKIYPSEVRIIIHIIGFLLGAIISLVLSIRSIFKLFIFIDIIDIFILIFSALLGVCLFLFFGYITIYLIKTLKSKKPITIFDKKGICDNVFHIARETFIPWKDIEKIYIGSILGIKTIEIKIKNEEEYLNNFNWWRKMIIESNKYFRIQYFNIGFFTAGIQSNDILSIILELFKKYSES